MNEDELERTLRGAFDAQARAAVGDDARPPQPRFASAPDGRRSGRRVLRWAAPFAAAAAVIVAATGAVVLTRSPSHPGREVGGSRPATPSTVHVKLLNDDGARYGVGMPVIAYFSKRVTDARAMQRATKASVNGKPVTGAWYFELSKAGKGPVEAHFRLDGYWPAHSDVRVALPFKGLSAGGGLRYDDSLTTEFHTGARDTATVNGATNRMTVTSDGRPYGTYKVSLGSTKTPTRPGTKVIMEKPGVVTMRSDGQLRKNVPDAMRVTYGGEYLHAAPWNVKNIQASVDSSNGCTNLMPADAQKLYAFLQIGDVVTYKNVTGPPMTLAAGYGDWNVPWAQWLTGGLAPTH